MAAARRVQVAGVGKTRTEELRKKRDKEQRRTITTEVRLLGEGDGGEREEEAGGQGEQPTATQPTVTSGQPPAAAAAAATAAAHDKKVPGSVTQQRVTDPDTDHGRCEGAHAPATQHPQHGNRGTAAPAGATAGDAAGTAAGAAAAPAPAPAPPPAPQILLQWGSPPRKEDIQINTEPSPLKEVLEGWVTTAPWWRGATPMLQNPICRICWVLQPPQTPPPYRRTS
jgi:hypothetical protein